MGKSVLVVDTPKNCRECKFSEMSYSGFDNLICTPEQKITYKFSEIKPNWCPLKEAPEKMDATYKLHFLCSETKCREYEYGWNSCLEEILGE